MLHVLIKTDDMGMRKAWFIGTALMNSYSEGIVVFKNNNKDKQFKLVPLSDIHLDTTFRTETQPVIESLQGINLELKKKSVKGRKD